MFSFEIIKKSRKSGARLGILKTSHGEIETPSFVPVATNATVKALDSKAVLKTGTQLLIANTYHLHLQPGEKIVKSAGGLHSFMQWEKPLMTDSGGFQVFSLGFGKDFNASKMSKINRHERLNEKARPIHIKITDDGVYFRSYVDGKEFFMGPRESMNIQSDLGADIIFAFDECPPPHAGKKYLEKSLEKTHRWAKISLEAHNPKQALYGIVQGGKYKDLRVKSARYIRTLAFDGYGIGGEFGASKKEMRVMLECVAKELPEKKPRHLLGVGYPEDIEIAVKAGMDTFDCITPTHYARRGFAYLTNGTMLDVKQRLYARDKKPLDQHCSCFVCGTYSRSYIHHLLRAHEITPLELLTFHNLHFFNSTLARMREKIRAGKL